MKMTLAQANEAAKEYFSVFIEQYKPSQTHDVFDEIVNQLCELDVHQGEAGCDGLRSVILRKVAEEAGWEPRR